MTQGEVLGFGSFIITNLVGIAWFARGLQKDNEETRREIRELKAEFKEHQENGSNLSRELRSRVERLEEFKKYSDTWIEKLRARTHDLSKITIMLGAKVGLNFTERENW